MHRQGSQVADGCWQEGMEGLQGRLSGGTSLRQGKCCRAAGRSGKAQRGHSVSQARGAAQRRESSGRPEAGELGQPKGWPSHLPGAAASLSSLWRAKPGPTCATSGGSKPSARCARQASGGSSGRPGYSVRAWHNSRARRGAHLHGFAAASRIPLEQGGRGLAGSPTGA